MKTMFRMTLLSALLLCLSCNQVDAANHHMLLEPAIYDPDGAGCVSSTFINIDHMLALHLVKTCPTIDPVHPDGTAAEGRITNVIAGTKLTELGWDITLDSQCGGGAPRFDVVGNDGTIWFFNCDFLKQYGTVTPIAGTNFVRVTCNPSNIPPGLTKQFVGQPAFTPTTPVKEIVIIFDVGPDQGTGFANLTHVTVNNSIIPNDLRGGHLSR